jgi:hypothetical protein
MLNEEQFIEKLDEEPLEKIFYDFCCFLGFNELARKINVQFINTINETSNKRSLAGKPTK